MKINFKSTKRKKYSYALKLQINKFFQPNNKLSTLIKKSNIINPKKIKAKIFIWVKKPVRKLNNSENVKQPKTIFFLL